MILKSEDQQSIISEYTPDVYTKLLLHGDSLLDSSGNSHIVTANGDASADNSGNPFGFGGVFSFDGNGDYLTIPDSTDFRFASEKFVIDLFIQFNSGGAGSHYDQIVNYGGAHHGWDTNDTSYEWTLLKHTTNGEIRFQWKNGTGTNNIGTLNSSTIPSADIWYHILVSYDGTTVRLYINDILEDSENTTLYTVTVPTGIKIATEPEHGLLLAGQLAELRMLKGSDNGWTGSTIEIPEAPYKISQECTVKFINTVKQASQLLLHGSEFKDSSGEGHTITAHGGTSANNSGGPFSEGGVYNFNGSSDNLEISDSTDFDFGSGDFVVDFWINPSIESRMAIFAGTTDFTYGIDFHFQGTRNINIWASSNGSSWDIVHADSGGGGIGGLSVPLNQFSHVAWVRSGNRWITYINGTKDIDILTTGTIVHKSEARHIGAWGGGISNWTGGISEFRSLKGSDNNWTGPTIDVPTSPYLDGKTSLLLHGSDLSDYSGNEHAITANGGASVDNSGNPFGFGGVFTCDDNGDYFSAPTSSDFGFSSNFVISGFVSFSGVSSTLHTVYSTTAAGGIHIYWDGGVYNAQNWRVSNRIDNQIDEQWGIPIIGQWYHIAVVRSGSTLSFYVDGVRIASSTFSTTYNSGASNIGGVSGSADDSLNGNISELLILNGSDNGWTGSTIDVPTSPYKLPQIYTIKSINTVKQISQLLLHGSEFKDSSGGGHAITAYGDTSVNNPGSPLGIGGVYNFDGTGDYLLVPISTNFELTNCKFAIGMWYRPTSGGAGSNYDQLGNYGGNNHGWDDNATGYQWTIIRHVTAGEFRFQWKNATPTNSTGDLVSSIIPVANEWYHVAVSYDGVTARLYINGILEDEETTTFYATTIPTSLKVGSNANQTTFLHGSLAEWSLSKGIDNDWTGPTIDVPTKPYPDGKTSLLLHGNNLKDYSGNNHIITVNGNVLMNNSGNPFGFGGVFDFDGNVNYLSTPASDDFNLGSGDFVFSLFVKFHSATYSSLFSQRQAQEVDCAVRNIAIDMGTKVAKFHYSTNGTTIKEFNTTIPSLAVGIFHFLAYVRNGNALYCYLDGNLEGTYNIGSDVIYSSLSNVRIGMAPIDFSPYNYNLLDGEIAEYRILKGTNNGYTGEIMEIPEAPYNFDIV